MTTVMEACSSVIRGTIIAPPGKKLVVSDLSNIEGRDLVWLSREEWKLQAFREFDTVLTASGDWLAGEEYRALCLARERPVLELNEKGEPVRKGHDLYKMAYAKSFGLGPGDVTKFGRSIGKVMELAFGFQGSLGAFITFSMVYDIDLDDMAAKAWDTLPDEAKEEARGLLEWYLSKGLSTYGLATNTVIVIFCFVNGWRAGHPNVKAMWKNLEDGFREAVSSPGTTVTTGRFRLRRDGAWLRLVLPSGRALCYPHPQVDDAGKCSYMGVNQFNRKWQRIPTYGGRLTENCCQSFARDILFDSTPAIEDAGYKIVMKVHDEVITEAPDSPEFNSDHLSALLATPPEYALDMPLAAAGFESYRYRKD